MVDIDTVSNQYVSASCCLHQFSFLHGQLIFPCLTCLRVMSTDIVGPVNVLKSIFIRSNPERCFKSLIKSEWWGTIPRPLAPKANALPSELHPVTGATGGTPTLMTRSRSILSALRLCYSATVAFNTDERGEV